MSKSRGSNKTVCRNWNGTPGSCSFGNNCRFLHSGNNDSGRSSTKDRCRNWNGTPGSCQFGDRCRFLHSQPDDPFSSNNSFNNSFTAASNPFAAASNPFAAASNPFASSGFSGNANPFGSPGGAVGATPNGFGASGFGTASGGGFGSNQGFGMQQSSPGNPFQQNQNNASSFAMQGGQNTNLPQALNTHLNPSRIAQNLMDYRSSANKIWPISCFTHREDCLSVPCDVDGDVSPEEVRWEYIKVGGRGCDGNSSAASNVNQAIMQHMSLLGQYYNSGMNDPNFVNTLMQSWQTKVQEHNSIRGNSTQAPSSSMPLPFANASLSQQTSSLNQSNNSLAQNFIPQSLNGALASNPASFLTPSKTDTCQSSSLPGLNSTPSSEVKQDLSSGSKLKSPERAPRTPITSEQTSMFLQSELHEYQSPQFSSLSSIPVYALPRDCDLA
mmetsp:Transcript_41522/g.130842  ORF Transcript_41522/g.130842 Transcript_41522/m.130842 type:complete len:441 (+) Transcript_41522:64-1386(+)